MGRIPPEIVHKVRQSADVVELIGRTVSLKRAGRNYKGLCPFHDEKTPSFNVNPDRGSYYCFGCQEGGDAISFLMKIENLTFIEAVRSLAATAGIEIPETSGGEASSTEPLFKANTLLAERYERRSTALTSNLVFSEWDRIFKNKMATSAAIDRLVHHSEILEFNVPSYRTEKAKGRKKD